MNTDVTADFRFNSSLDYSPSTVTCNVCGMVFMQDVYSRKSLERRSEVHVVPGCPKAISRIFAPKSATKAVPRLVRACCTI
jgi:hypothetical protein